MTSITSTLRRNVDNLSQFVALSLLAIVILIEMHDCINSSNSHV